MNVLCFWENQSTPFAHILTHSNLKLTVSPLTHITAFFINQEYKTIVDNRTTFACISKGIPIMFTFVYKKKPI